MISTHAHIPPVYTDHTCNAVVCYLLTCVLQDLRTRTETLSISGPDAVRDVKVGAHAAVLWR